MERNIQRNGLVNLLALLAVGGAGFAVARYDGSLAGQVTAVFLGLGVLVAFVSWFQARLEEGERIEKLELEEMARSKGSATLFESKEAEIFPAARSRQQFEKYFIPVFTVLLLLLQAGSAYFLWRWLAKLPEVPPLKDESTALALFGLFALVLFLLGRFSATIARIENHRLLRPSASYLLLGAYLCIVTAGGIAAVKAEFHKADFYVAHGLCVVLALNAVETLLTLILEIYRPRLKGKVVRPLYESRFVGLLGQPEGLITTAAQALDYQFGFKVSETWFLKFLARAWVGLTLMQLGVLLLSTCFVVVDSGEQALLERFGRPVAGREVLGPGLHLKWPWPVDRAYPHRTEEIQMITIGFTPDDHAVGIYGNAVLWTLGHGDEENFLVANREQRALEVELPPGERKAPPVSLLTVNIPVQYQIRNLVDWTYNYESSAALLQLIATREVVRYLVSADMNEIMSDARLEAAGALRDRIQSAVNASKLGADILFVGLQGIHPPVKVAADYEKVVGAAQKRVAMTNNATGDAIRTNALAAARAFSVTNAAEAGRLRVELTALARAAAFTNQIPAFNAAPSVYRQRAYAQAFAEATARVRKFVLLTRDTQDVISYDLQQQIDTEYLRQLDEAAAPPKTQKSP